MYLFEDFDAEIAMKLCAQGVEKIGLHVNPISSTLGELLKFVERERPAIEQLEREGVSVEYEVHVIGDILPRECFSDEPELFRMDESGARTPNYNLCPSSERAMRLLEDGAERLARTLRQASHRYHFWPDDDMGGDVRCHCPRCKKMSATVQNRLMCEAILRGLRRYDREAQNSLLIYGMEEIDEPLPSGIYAEFAPFRRMHAIPITEGEINDGFRERLERLLKMGDTEVLEYFLSYDFEGFVRESGRVEADLHYYRSIGVEHISTFVVFPKGISRARKRSGLLKYIAL